jgi:hypothetical protein
MNDLRILGKLNPVVTPFFRVGDRVRRAKPSLLFPHEGSGTVVLVKGYRIRVKWDSKAESAIIRSELRHL